MNFEKTPKQKEAIDLISKNTTTLLEGGSRSGKTFIIIYSMVVRALHYPNTWHIALRLRFNHARQSLWLKTIPDVLRAIGIESAVELNHSDLVCKCPNGSLVMVAGLDDKDRTEKILGNEYATIFLNEASQVSYGSYELLTTRLNPPKTIPARFLIDYNPPSIKHWGYKIFHDRRFPDGRQVPDNDYGTLKINPIDNKDNISDNYFNILQNLSGNKRRRFLDGEYVTEEGALWKREWFKYMPTLPKLVRVVIGVDPSGSQEGDEIGIIAAGIDKDGKVYVLGDYSLNGTTKEWGEEVRTAYSNNLADIVAAEKNYGGEMVEAVISELGQKQINVKLVNASRGKAVRAEPVAVLYEKGEVYHAEQFTMLEDELTTWKPDADKSPNRLDALVWAITELKDIDLRYKDYAGINKENEGIGDSISLSDNYL